MPWESLSRDSQVQAPANNSKKQVRITNRASFLYISHRCHSLFPPGVFAWIRLRQFRCFTDRHCLPLLHHTLGFRLLKLPSVMEDHESLSCYLCCCAACCPLAVHTPADEEPICPKLQASVASGSETCTLVWVFGLGQGLTLPGQWPT